MVVPAALARVYASAPSDDDYVETLELRHPLFTQTYYLVNQPAPFTAKLEGGATQIFQPFPFAIIQPMQSGEGQQDLTLALDNVDQTVIAELERANADPTTKMEAAYRIYTESNPNAPAFIIAGLSISDATATDVQISAVASRTDVLNKPFPSQLYTVTLFPGLDR